MAYYYMLLQQQLHTIPHIEFAVNPVKYTFYNQINNYRINDNWGILPFHKLYSSQIPIATNRH